MTARPQHGAIVQCEGKVRFATYRLAARIARKQTERHGERYEPYRCRHCQGLHIGSGAAKPKPEPKPERYSRADLMKIALGGPIAMLIIVGLCYGVEMLR